MMDPSSQFANQFVALADLSETDRIAALFRRLRILDNPERNDIGVVAGILYVPQRLDHCIVCHQSCH
jgi:hypothetical protein